MRFLVVAVVAMFSIAAATAFAANTYNFSGNVPKGGSKAKPKITGFSFNYSIADDAGNLPVVVKAYKFEIGGLRADTSADKSTSTAAQINAPGRDDPCSSQGRAGPGSGMSP